MSSKLTMLSLSDLHLGHNNVPAQFIIDNLNTIIKDDSSMANIDIIWLCGDIFDQLLYFSDQIIGEIECWIAYVLYVCKKWNISLRILEGTPSHDRGQSIHFINKAKLLNFDLDIKYIDKLSIEYMSKYDIHVLYVPDEYHATTQETWNAVQQLLLEHNLTKVDYAIMHGMFEHQLPKGFNLPHHLSSNYLSIVKKYIFIGHIHQMSVMDRILAQGSTDRLQHGEEEDKGYWYVESYKNNTASDVVKFMINEGAMIFKSIDWTRLEYDQIESEMRKYINYPSNSHLRIIVEKDHAKIALYESFKKRYNYYFWDIKKVQDKSEINNVFYLSTFQPIPINENTIETLVEEKMRFQGVDILQQQSVLSLLRKVK